MIEAHPNIENTVAHTITMYDFAIERAAVTISSDQFDDALRVEFQSPAVQEPTFTLTDVVPPDDEALMGPSTSRDVEQQASGCVKAVPITLARVFARHVCVSRLQLPEDGGKFLL